MAKKKKYRSHVKKGKILWSRVFFALFAIVLLIAIIIVSIAMAIKSNDKSSKIIATTNVAVENLPTSVNATETATVNPEFNVQSISADKSFMYIIPNRTKSISVEVKADNSAAVKNIEWSSSNEKIAKVDDQGNVTGVAPGNCSVTAKCGNAETKVDVTVRNVAKKNGVTYIDNILIVNKEFSLPEDYNPGDIINVAQDAFDKMTSDAAKENLNIYKGSGFRDYNYQVEIFNNYSKLYGEEYANTFSSKPGHSEHQSGYAIDCNTINSDFDSTDEAKWLEKHAADYGFIIRFPKGKETITGYEYESWHVRYVGEKAAKEIKEQNLCLEEYLGVDETTYDISASSEDATQ